MAVKEWEKHTEWCCFFEFTLSHDEAKADTRVSARFLLEAEGFEEARELAIKFLSGSFEEDAYQITSIASYQDVDMQ